MTLEPLWAIPVGLLVLATSLALHATHLHGAGRVRLHLHLAQKAHRHLALALVSAVLAGVLAGALGATGYHVLYGPQGPLEPPLVALRGQGMHGGGRHGLGFVARPGRTGQPRTYGVGPVPAAVDLSQYAPPVGDQGTLNSCASWAVGYGLASYYAARSGPRLPGGGAPMFLYSQATHGRDSGTPFPLVYALLLRTGIAARAQYAGADTNYQHLPSQAERRRADHWRRHSSLRSWVTLFLGQGQGSSAREVLSQALAAGNPVTLGLPVYDNLMNAGPRSYFISRRQGQYWGAHALVLYKYDANGVWAMNSWGTSWGLGGWGELSWDFVERYALEADELVTS